MIGTNQMANDIKFTPAALANIDETGTNWRTDVAGLLAGTTREELLEHCLDGAEEDRVEGWHDYVEAVVFEAEESDLSITG